MQRTKRVLTKHVLYLEAAPSLPCIANSLATRKVSRCTFISKSPSARYFVRTLGLDHPFRGMSFLFPGLHPFYPACGLAENLQFWIKVHASTFGDIV